jgi:MFS family permease
MECEDFYKQNVPYAGPGDRCARNEIDATTAEQVALSGMIFNVCSIFNLFLAGWELKKWGPRAALVLQTACPAVRSAVQLFGIAVIGGRGGIAMMQASQIIGISGGVAGYLLVLNTTIAEVVDPEERTGVFGQLQGCVMLGTSVGYVVGGTLGDLFGINSPWHVSCVMFLLSCMYAGLCTPYLPPSLFADSSGTKEKGLRAIFGPLKLLRSTNIFLSNGKTATHYGVPLLAVGVFLGVLATGYAPTLLQMYATAAFRFSSTENGYLMAVNALVRGILLILAFPRIISSGRQWYQSSRLDKRLMHEPDPTDADKDVVQSSCRSLTEGEILADQAETSGIPTQPEDFEPPQGALQDQEPAAPLQATSEDGGRGFDLFFLRWSLVVDGLVTGSAAFASQSWQVYMAGALLPLASGTAPASKGVITEMCPPGKRTEALQAMTLVENIAMLSTLGLFGFVFSAFSQVGQAHLTFYCNAVRLRVPNGMPHQTDTLCRQLLSLLCAS